MRGVDALDVLDRLPQVLAEPAVEAHEERPVPRRREAFRKRDREHRLAASRRTGDRGPPPVRDEREHPGLVRGELDDLAVLLVEPEPKRRAHLDAEPERLGDRVHALGAEPPARARPGAHHLGHPIGQTRQVAAVDHDLDRRARMRRLVIGPVRERQAVPEGRPPPLPPGLRLQDPNERMHRALRLLERILVQRVRAGVAGGRPSSRAPGRTRGGHPWPRARGRRARGARSRSPPPLRPLPWVRRSPSPPSGTRRTRRAVARGSPRRGVARRRCPWGASGTAPSAPRPDASPSVTPTRRRRGGVDDRSLIRSLAPQLLDLPMGLRLHTSDVVASLRLRPDDLIELQVERG